MSDEAIIVRTLEGLRRHVSQATAQTSGPEEALARFMIAHADFFEDHYDGFLTMLVGYGGMENVVMIAEAQKLRDEHEQALRHIIADGIAKGAFRPIDIDVTSRAVLSMLNWMVRWFKPGKGRRAAGKSAAPPGRFQVRSRRRSRCKRRRVPAWPARRGAGG